MAQRGLLFPPNPSKAEDALDRAMQNKPGAGKNQHSLNNNVTEARAPVGNSAEKALRTLRSKRPDLHVNVMENLI